MCGTKSINQTDTFFCIVRTVKGRFECLKFDHFYLFLCVIYKQYSSFTDLPSFNLQLP